MANYYDGEVIRLSESGTVIQWNTDTKCEYDSGETLDEWGTHNLTYAEKDRIIKQISTDSALRAKLS